MYKATKKQIELLEFINSFIEKKGFAPSIQEMAKHFDIGNYSIICRLDRLVGHGFLTREANISRGIRVINSVKN